MYPVTALFQSKIKETTRMFKSSIEIQHSAGVLTLTDKDIILGTMQIDESSQSGQNFTVGGIVAGTFNVEIVNKTDSINGSFTVDNILVTVDEMLHTVDYYEDYVGINFEGATIIPQVALQVSESPEVWEYVPLGKFKIDEVNKQRNTIQIKAIDNMIELDKPYDLSGLGYPATLYQIYTNICNVADVNIGTVSFVNQGYMVDKRPEGDYTLRDMLAFVAELSGTFARFNRLGALELVWYTNSGLTLTGANRFNFIPREDLVQIRGVSRTIVDNTGEEITYLAGFDDYTVDFSSNPLLQNNFETVLSNVYNNVKDTIFTPYDSRWQGNPAIQCGDAIIQVDRDGNSYNTLVTHSSYKYRGACTLSAKGLPIKAKGYKGSTNKKIAEIKRKIEQELGNKLTSLEQAQLNVTELIANMLGGYVVQGTDALYIADNQDINLARKVWKWGIGGFGYSSTGIAGPYTAGISADGTIVAMLVSANIVTANMIETGVMTSVKGNMVIDLNNNVMRVADDLGRNRVLLGEYEANKFGIQIKDTINNRTLLDENGLMNSWQQNVAENFDSNHSAKLKFYLPPNAGNIINLNLSFSLEKFRSYVDMVYLSDSSFIDFGGGFTGIKNAGSVGNHAHSALGYSGASGGHSHTVDISHSHTADFSHGHNLRYAVFEVGAPTDVGIKIDGVDRTSELGGLRSGEITVSDLNIKPYVTTNGWHTIEFFMPANTVTPVVSRVVANIFGMIFMYAPN